MANDYCFTSESVSEGHPDKVADQISDAVLDAVLAQDPKARVAAETLCGANLVVLAGEISSTAEVDYEAVARSTLAKIGYDHFEVGLDYRHCRIICAYERQSPDIAQGVDRPFGQDFDQGAGDQGLMFGYACDETEVLMPLPIHLAHRLVENQAAVRRSGRLPWLRPDAKAQVSVRYADGRPIAIDTIVLSTQHHPDVDLKTLREAVVEEVIKPVLPAHLSHSGVEFLINPTGRFVIGGPRGDCGLTGRKIIVDTYGGAAPHGGGAFSGKDPSKVDRSAAYMARYLAKNVVAAGLAKQCLIQISYAIGVARPVSFMVDTKGSGKIDDNQLAIWLAEHFDLRPRKLIELLDLTRPIFAPTAVYGHFGRESFPWEAVDFKERLLAAFG